MLKKHKFAIFCILVLLGFVLYYFFDDRASALAPRQVQEDFATGLNDATFSGTYSDGRSAKFTVTIDGTDVPISAGSGCILVTGALGYFGTGDILTGGTSGATAEISNALVCREMGPGTRGVYLINVVGTFQVGESLTGSSGESGTYSVGTITFPPGVTDTVSWTEVGGSGSSGSHVLISSLALFLANGISINFGAATGHTLGDHWTYTITVPTSSGGSGATAQTRYSNLLKMGKTEEAKSLKQEFPTRINHSNGTTTKQTDNNNVTQTPETPDSFAKIIFSKKLQMGDINTDIKELQKFLNSNGYIVAITGPGSLNNETDYFGQLTFDAVKKFQKANNLKVDGIVGPKTNSVINSLIK